MIVNVTSRHFKAHQSVVDHAEQAVTALTRYFDGIIKCDVVLSYEKTRRSMKNAEVIVSVARQRIAAADQSEDFMKSIDRAVDKVLVQLKKHKERMRMKDRVTVRRVQEKV